MARVVLRIIAIGSGPALAAAFVLQPVAPEQVDPQLWLWAGICTTSALWLVRAVRKARGPALPGHGRQGGVAFR